MKGVQFAIDSLTKEKVPLEIFIYDTRSVQRNLLEQINEIDTSIGLIIAHANAQENWVLAGEANLRKIPYINVNLPNDGGIVNNPLFYNAQPFIKNACGKCIPLSSKIFRVEYDNGIQEKRADGRSYQNIS
jgi:hypothetical protein